MAEKLFAEGKDLMKAGRTAEACDKFQASHDIDRNATGTLLNLALCHEALGRKATAWAEFRQVISESGPMNRQDRIVLAREHEAKLFPVLAYVLIAVRPAARVQGLRIKLDQRRELEQPLWGAELPIDPGHHVLDVEADGMIGKRYEIDVPDRPGDQTVDVVELAIAPRPPDIDAVEREQRSRRARRRTLGWVLGGSGAAVAGTGAVLGVLALQKNRDGKDMCRNTVCPDDATYRTASGLRADSKTFALAADITIGAGAALSAIGIYLLVTRPAEPAAPVTALGLAPVAGGSTLSVWRSW